MHLFSQFIFTSWNQTTWYLINSLHYICRSCAAKLKYKQGVSSGYLMTDETILLWICLFACIFILTCFRSICFICLYIYSKLPWSLLWYAFNFQQKCFWNCMRKLLLKYIEVRSYFDRFDWGNIIVQLDFKFDAWL